MTETTWGERCARTIAAQIRHHRKSRGLSAQQLSDACTTLGHPIHRSVLANLENGRRADVSVAELFTLARALNVPPIALMLPEDGPVEIGDGQYASRADAHAWISGVTVPSALDTLAAELGAAREATERARAALAGALAGPPVPHTSDLDGYCASAMASSINQVAEAFAQLQSEADAQRSANR